MQKGSGFDFKGMPARWPDRLASRWRGPSWDPALGTPRGCRLAPTPPAGQLPLATASLGSPAGAIPKPDPFLPPGSVLSGRARHGASDALCAPHGLLPGARQERQRGGKMGIPGPGPEAGKSHFS